MPQDGTTQVMKIGSTVLETTIWCPLALLSPLPARKTSFFLTSSYSYQIIFPTLWVLLHAYISTNKYLFIVLSKCQEAMELSFPVSWEGEGRFVFKFSM